MAGGILNANAQAYLDSLGLNVTPPTINSDGVVAGGVPIEMVLQVLGLAANASDPEDNGEATRQHGERGAKAGDAAAKFPAQDEAGQADMNQVAQQGQGAQAQDPASQMAQQLPQMASQLAGALAGALGGALQPLAQIPQQIAQGAQQAMQAGMGAMQDAGKGDIKPEDLIGKDGLGDLGDPLGEGAGGGGEGAGGGGSGGGGIGTTPTAMLGPPATPTSAQTVPTAGKAAMPMSADAAAQARPMAGGGGMGGMMPHGMGGHGGAEAKEAKAETKRVAAPGVKNGAPVQGRITTPPPAPVTKKVEGKPIATRRIVMPGDKPDERATEAEAKRD